MKKRIAVLFPAFMGGGAESVCAWMLEALKQEYEITLFTLTLRGFKKLNDFYGTDLSVKDVRIACPVPKLFLSILKFIFNNIKAFRPERQRWLNRYFRNFNERFDLAISVYNEMDMGKPGMQYIHWINVVGREKEAFFREKIRQNLTLTNSKCTAEHIKKSYGIEAKVIYPPVISDFPSVSWKDKKDGFVCIGRLSAAKSPHMVIRIIKKVREEGFDVHLHIIGSQADLIYMNYLKKMQKDNPDWVFIEKNLSSREVANLVAKHKYGIHWKIEPFGIIVAEMMKAGCIPFVRSEGGQVEIVDEYKPLLFNSEDEAVNKICTMLADENKQAQTLSYLSERKELFSEEKFMNEIRKVVRDFFEKN